MYTEINFDLAVLYYTNSANKAEIEEFEIWLNVSADNKEIYKTWVECWEATGKTYLNLNAETNKAWNIVSKQTIDKEVEKKNNRSIGKIFMKIAASVALLVTLAGVTYWLYDTEIYKHEPLLTYSSGSDTMSVVLSDGTQICLNKNSVLKAPSVFKRKRRQVYLNGEAFFNVTHNERRPFKIFTGNTITQVLGTTFNLKAYSAENQIVLTLIRGKVAFYKKGKESEKTIIFSGQQITYNSITDSFLKNTVNDLNILAWKTGKLQFKNASLSELCKALSGFYKLKIDYEDGQAQNEKELFTGNFNNIPFEDALVIIEMTINVKIDRLDDKINISYK